MLKLCGAELHLVDALPYKNPGNYIRYSETLSKKIKNPNGVLWANQFDNLSNKKSSNSFCKDLFSNSNP